MLGWKHQGNKKVPITDGYVDYHREIGINKVSTVWAAVYFYICCVFYFTDKRYLSGISLFSKYVFHSLHSSKLCSRKENVIWATNQTLKSHRSAKCCQSLRSLRKQVSTTN